MKKIKPGLIACVVLMLCSCARPQNPVSAPSYTNSSEPDELAAASSHDSQTGRLPEPSPQIPESPFSPEDAEPYSGQPYTVVGDNIPYFSEEEFTTSSFSRYSELDELGRCGPAYACVGPDLMPTQERGQIGNVRPTGWHTVKYNEIIDGNYLYNRCHLIGYLLAGENANEQNLITGTRYLNVRGMLPFETKVADYVTETGNHVLYRVTPVFQDENLLASGVLMEAESVEDEGRGVCFCVYVYNVQPGIAIDYATGESAIAPDARTPESAQVSRQPAAESTAPSPEPDTEVTGSMSQETPAPSVSAQTPESAQAPFAEPASPQEEQPQGTAYVLNTNTKKFHYPSCRSVDQMKEKNKQNYTGTRDEVISMGYDPCKSCNP